jgi:hypothetical protein
MACESSHTIGRKQEDEAREGLGPSGAESSHFSERLGMALAYRLAEVCMLGIPHRFSHFVYGFTQSGLTCAKRRLRASPS